MDIRTTLHAVFLLLLVLIAPCLSSPIHVTIDGYDGVAGVHTSFDLPEGAKSWPVGTPYTLTSGDFSGLGLPSPHPPDGWQGGEYRDVQSSTYHSSFDLKITFEAKTPGSLTADRPTVHVTGPIEGEFHKQNAWDNIGGGVWGSAKTADLSGWTPDSAVPWSIIEPLLHPDQVSIGGGIGGGNRAMLWTDLRVRPDSGPAIPMPTPEPSTLALGALVICGCGIRRLVNGHRGIRC